MAVTLVVSPLIESEIREATGHEPAAAASTAHEGSVNGASPEPIQHEPLGLPAEIGLPDSGGFVALYPRHILLYAVLGLFVGIFVKEILKVEGD